MSATVRQVAAHLPKALRTDDQAEISRLMSQIRSVREVTDLVFLLARCADWGRLNAETGFIAAGTPNELHAYFTRLRSRGVPKGDIAEYILAGEREYQRLHSRAARARAARLDQRENEGAAA